MSERERFIRAFMEILRSHETPTPRRINRVMGRTYGNIDNIPGRLSKLRIELLKSFYFAKGEGENGRWNPTAATPYM